MAEPITVDNGALTDYAVLVDDVTDGTLGTGAKQLVGLTDATVGSTTKVAAGGGAEANALRVTVASDSTGVLSVDDNGSSLTVDGTVTVGSLPAVAGTVAVSALPAIPAGSNNIGDVDIATVPAPLSTSGGGTEAAALRVTLASDSTGLVSVDDNGGSLTVDGTVAASIVSGTVAVTGISGTVAVSSLPALPAGNNNVGDVDVASVPAPLSTTGGGTEATALRVTVATDSTGVLSVDDNGGSLTVDGTVGIGSLSGTVAVSSIGSTVTVDGSGVTQPVSHAALTELAAAIDTELQVDVVGALPAGNNNIGDVDVVSVPAPLSTTGGGTEAAALRVTVANDSTGVLSVDDNGGSLTVDGTVAIGALSGTVAVSSIASAIPAGNNNIGDVDVASIAAGDNNIGNVDIVTMPNVTLAAGTNTNEVVGDAAHDAAVAGNPVLVGFEAKDQDGSALPNAVSAEGDVVRAAASLAGVQYVMPVNEDGSAVASITANAGTNLNTSALALESGGNLAGAATSLAILDDWDESDRAKVNPIAGQAGVQGGSGAVSALTQRVVLATDVALPTGANAIGKLAANSGVDIGDVDVTSIAAGTNNIGRVVPIGAASDGLSIFRSIDLDEGTLEQVKGSAGTVYGMWVTNTATATRWIKFYDATSGTAGTGTPVITIGIPGNTSDDIAGNFGPGGVGIAFATGICVGATTGVADSDTGAPGANDVIVNIFYK